MNCLGERAGNVSLAEIAVALHDKLGMELSIDESSLAPVSEMVESFSGKRLADNAPIVGENVFTQTSGIHADGDKKANLYHNPIAPERFGRKRSYALGKMSGKASLAKNLELLGIQLVDENLNKVLKRVVELGDSKKSMTAADLPFIITDVLETSETQRIELLNCSISSGLNLKATAGNGGYDAFMSAVNKILKKLHLDSPELVDYQIRIPRGGKTNALTEAIITWQVNGKRLQTVGIDSDQVIAAVNATLKLLNLQLLQKDVQQMQ
jgi:D-citramalate synthase